MGCHYCNTERAICRTIITIVAIPCLTILLLKVLDFLLYGTH